MPRHSILLACVILLANAHCTAQEVYAGSMRQPHEPGKLKLSGVVVNSVTGEPIPRALVQVFLGGQHAALTGSDGKFQLDGLEPGRTVVAAQKPGFFNEQETGRLNTQPKLVEITSDTSDIVVRLIPESVIYGLVRDADHEPVEHAFVRVNISRIMEGRRHWAPLGQANSNSAGEFRVANLPPGKYYITVAASRRSVFSAQAPDGYASIYYPAAPETSSTDALELSAGQKLPLDFSLQSVPVFKISGVISAPPSGQFSSVEILDHFGEHLPFPFRVDQQSGKFEVTSAPAGTYTLVCRGNDEAQHQLRAELVLGVSTTVTGLHLFLTPAPSLEVKVQTDFEKPQPSETRFTGMARGGLGSPQMAGIRDGISGGNVGKMAAAESPLVSVRLRSTGPLQQDSWSTFEGPPSHRLVSVTNIASGRFAVDVQSQYPQGYVQSAVSGGVNLFTEELVVESGGKLAPVEVVLRDDGGMLSGTVTAGEQPFSGTVIAVPAFAPLQSPRMVHSGADGTFEFSNLAPGDYQVFAFDQIERVEYANRDVMRNYSSKAASVSISSVGKSVVTLQPILVDEP